MPKACRYTGQKIGWNQKSGRQLALESELSRSTKSLLRLLYFRYRKLLQEFYKLVPFLYLIHFDLLANRRDTLASREIFLLCLCNIFAKIQAKIHSPNRSGPERICLLVFTLS